MERANLCVTLWALIDLWRKKRRKVLSVSLAQDNGAQVSSHQCPSLQRAQHNAQHHPFVGSSICGDSLWAMPSQQPSTHPCSLQSCDHRVTPATLSAALLYLSLKHSLLPAQGSATQGQWASLDTTETHSEV